MVATADTALVALVEFAADKGPWVDSLWDTAHTFIRSPAGAALAYGALGGDQGTWAMVAALLGGTLAATAAVSDCRSTSESFDNTPVAAGIFSVVPVSTA